MGIKQGFTSGISVFKRARKDVDDDERSRAQPMKTWKK